MNRKSIINYVKMDVTSRTGDGTSNLSHMIDSSRLQLIKTPKDDGDNEKLKEQEESKIKEKRIRHEYKKITKTTNLKKFMYFMYFALIMDILFLLFYSYLLINAFTDVRYLGLSIIYLFKYGFTIVNTVLYLRIIIVYGDHRLKRLREIENAKIKNIRKLKKINTTLNMDKKIKIYLNKPLQAIRQLITFRLIFWQLKYFLYILIVGIEKKISFLEYINIPVAVIDYFLFHVQKFYYNTLLRIEAYREFYGFEDDFSDPKKN
jgi:hypothetical protein